MVPQGRVTLKMSARVPQGIILGPILWNVLYDGILRLDLGEMMETYAYADDLVLVNRAINTVHNHGYQQEKRRKYSKRRPEYR